MLVAGRLLSCKWHKRCTRPRRHHGPRTIEATSEIYLECNCNPCVNRQVCEWQEMCKSKHQSEQDACAPQWFNAASVLGTVVADAPAFADRAQSCCIWKRTTIRTSESGLTRKLWPTSRSALLCRSNGLPRWTRNAFHYRRRALLEMTRCVGTMLSPTRYPELEGCLRF